jgi:hypothetical protein
MTIDIEPNTTTLQFGHGLLHASIMYEKNIQQIKKNRCGIVYKCFQRIISM